jgi:hypothetical protein
MSMRFFTAVGVAGISAVAAWAQPANNACANAIAVAAGTVNGTTIGSTNDGTGSCGASASSPDVWYRYVAPLDGTLTLSTCGGATWDTVLSVWSGCPGVGGEIACLDDSCGVQTELTVNIENGTQYWIRVAGYNNATGAFALTLDDDPGDPPPPPGNGPDVVYSEITDVAQYGPVGGVYAYAFGTGTCNIGDTDLRWGNSWGGSPSVGFNAYRIYDGRLMQIGQSWVKRACCAAAGAGCSIACNGVGGSLLGTGCRDVYGAGYNGSHGVLARRSSLNAFTGVHALVGGSGDAIWGRLQIPAADLSAATYPGALYFAEGVYVGSDDAPAANAFNNASYRRMTVAAPATLNLTGVTHIGEGAIYAWRDQGLNGSPDPSVTIVNVDVPAEGRFTVAHKVRDLGNGTWRYDYAILNINSDRSGGSFSVPIPAGTTITNVGFNDVAYHSGEPFDNTNWIATVGATSVSWNSPQTFAQNPNSNALRWGTMYNFWFDANRPPASANATLGLFKPHSTQSVLFTARAPAPPIVPGDLNGDGHVDLTDLAMLLADYGCNTAPCAGDTDGDGDTDLVDLATLLANFGT